MQEEGGAEGGYEQVLANSWMRECDAGLCLAVTQWSSGGKLNNKGVFCGGGAGGVRRLWPAEVTEACTEVNCFGISPM